MAHGNVCNSSILLSVKINVHLIDCRAFICDETWTIICAFLDSADNGIIVLFLDFAQFDPMRVLIVMQFRNVVDNGIINFTMI